MPAVSLFLLIKQASKRKWLSRWFKGLENRILAESFDVIYAIYQLSVLQLFIFQDLHLSLIFFGAWIVVYPVSLALNSLLKKSINGLISRDSCISFSGVAG